MSELGFIVVCWVVSFCLGWVLLCFAVSRIMVGYCFFPYCRLSVSLLQRAWHGMA